MHQQLALPCPDEERLAETWPVHGQYGEALPAVGHCQRWRNRRHSWIHRSAGGFDPSRYSVAPIDEGSAKAYVVAHHYSGTYPAAARRLGLFLNGADTAQEPELVGVAVFGIPPRAAVLTNVFPTLEPYVQSLELSRFVLEGDKPAELGGAPAAGRAPANSESWFLARCFEHLAANDVQGIVAFSDPVPRRIGGTVLFPGHFGTIYQASNAVFTGRGTPRTLIVLPDGATLSDRTAQKVRRGEQGHDYVERRLIALGARPLRVGYNRAAWLFDALNDIGAVRMRHPGNLRYAMVTSRRHRRQVKISGTSRSYPKRDGTA